MNGESNQPGNLFSSCPPINIHGLIKPKRRIAELHAHKNEFDFTYLDGVRIGHLDSRQLKLDTKECWSPNLVKASTSFNLLHGWSPGERVEENEDKIIE